MQDHRFQSLWARQEKALNHKELAAAPNRKGLRELTGDLLEAAFVDLVTEAQPDVSIEVGAHEASYSARVRERLPNTRVLAFEANPYVFQKYAEEVTSPPNPIEYVNMAISDRNGVVDLNIPTAWANGEFARTNAISSLRTRDGGAFECETVSVPATTLDDASGVAEVSTGVAWIDAEGAQQEILIGGKKFLSLASLVYIEVETRELWKEQHTDKEIAQELKRLGLAPLIRDNLAKHQYNVIYYRRGHRAENRLLEIAEAYVAKIEKSVFGQSK